MDQQQHFRAVFRIRVAWFAFHVDIIASITVDIDSSLYLFLNLDSPSSIKTTGNNAVNASYHDHPNNGKIPIVISIN